MFNSRNASFLPGIKEATNGRGVDLVLNSLSGELLHASWQCVAEYGNMIEIGKRDFIGRAKLDMDLFEGNRAFFGVDLATLPNKTIQSYGSNPSNMKSVLADIPKATFSNCRAL